MLLLLACAAPDTDEPPEIVEKPFLDGAEVEIGPEGQSFYVIAEDPEEADLDFVWTLSEDGPQEGLDIVGRQGSQLDLAWDEGLDGQELACTVSDGVSSVGVSWTLVVVADTGG